MTMAIYASLAAGTEEGGYDRLEDAVAVMSKLLDRVYYPSEEKHQIYNRLYAQYKIVHDVFGIENDVMKQLKKIKEGDR